MKLLVPYDGSKDAGKALREAVSLAKLHDGELKVLNVYWDPEVREFDGTEVRDRYSIKVLSEVKPILEEGDVKYEFLSKHDPDPSKIIIECAEEDDVDLIVMGKRGLDGSDDKDVGSVSSRVIQDSNRAVLIKQ
jgi:nucleotide-binding universal stress UspA family protein